MAPKLHTVYLLSDEAIAEINRRIKAMTIKGVCEELGVSPKSLRSWLCKGQSISPRKREAIKKWLGKDAIVAEKL